PLGARERDHDGKRGEGESQGDHRGGERADHAGRRRHPREEGTHRGPRHPCQRRRRDRVLLRVGAGPLLVLLGRRRSRCAPRAGDEACLRRGAPDGAQAQGEPAPGCDGPRDPACGRRHRDAGNLPLGRPRMSRPPAPVPDATPRDDELAAQLRETLAALRPFTRDAPRVALVLGSGLGGVAEALRDRVDMATRDLPHWPASTVPRHAGSILFGRWRGTRVVALSGRTHRYEGYALARVTYPVRILAALGARTIVLTNSAGSTQREIRPGELMLVRDHVNFVGRRGLFTRDELRARLAGRRVASCYSAELALALHAGARAAGIPLRQGTLLGTHGPAHQAAAA